MSGYSTYLRINLQSPMNDAWITARRFCKVHGAWAVKLGTVQSNKAGAGLGVRSWICPRCFDALAARQRDLTTTWAGKHGPFASQ